LRSVIAAAASDRDDKGNNEHSRSAGSHSVRYLPHRSIPHPSLGKVAPDHISVCNRNRPVTKVR
jgi:hypothetical protein